MSNRGSCDACIVVLIGVSILVALVLALVLLLLILRLETAVDRWRYSRRRKFWR